MIAALAMVLAGCASQQASTQRADVGASPSHIARAPKEADGWPSQLTPRHMHPLPDDPTEPWSPSYGARPRAKDLAPVRGPAPIDAGQTRMATVDDDAVVRLAIAEHEKQRQ